MYPVSSDMFSGHKVHIPKPYLALVYRVVPYQMLVWYQMYTWVTSDRSAAWNWAPRVGRIICVTALRFFLVGSSSSLSSTLPPASFPPALYHRNNWTIVQVCGVKKKCASNTTCTGKVFSHRPVTLTWLANRALRSFYKNSLSL